MTPSYALLPRVLFIIAALAYAAAVPWAQAATPGAAPTAQASELQHRGVGTIKALAPKAGTVTLDHSPIKSLGWPAMTMDFTVQAQARDVLNGLKVGDEVEFDVAKDEGGKYTLSRIVRASKSPAR